MFGYVLLTLDILKSHSIFFHDDINLLKSVGHILDLADSVTVFSYIILKSPVFAITWRFRL